MKRSHAPKKTTLRRLATAFGVSGLLVMSSGVALMVASPANAAVKGEGHTPVNVCHATSSDSNPFIFITVDDDSTKFKGHLMHREDPNKKWQNDGTFNGVEHEAGDLKKDRIGDYVDSDGVKHTYDGVITEATCEGEVSPPEVPLAFAEVDFFGPTCEFPDRAEYDAEGKNVEFSIKSGEATPGSDLVITATAINDAEFAGGATTQDFEFSFDDEIDPNVPPCAETNPPGIASASVSFIDPSCANDNTPGAEVTEADATVELTSGTVAAGESVVYTATANEGFTFDDESLTQEFEHTFGSPIVGCTIVNPPDPIITPTVVESGLVSAQDLRGEQGLALLVSGMALMVMAGAFGIGSARRVRS
ncbi:MAG: hypothetical protein NTV23_00865 [Propionibacteriales bacterium]|nr:hypothetical protein [Propionibacteriales bacterium]